MSEVDLTAAIKAAAVALCDLGRSDGLCAHGTPLSVCDEGLVDARAAVTAAAPIIRTAERERLQAIISETISLGLRLDAGGSDE